MKIIATLFMACLFVSSNATAQTADGQFTTVFDGSTLEVTVELQGNPVNQLATTTLRFTYNQTGLSFPASPTAGVDFVYQNYNGFFPPSNFYSSTLTNNSGEVSVNIVLSSAAGEDLPSSWTPVVTLYFDIIDALETTDFAWTLVEVFKVPGTPSDQYTNGTFADLDIPLDPGLPIELTTFTASADEDAVVLNWTAADALAKGFDVQTRPVGGTSWRTVGSVANGAKSGESFSYRVSDLPVGTHEFRLAQRATDGSVAYSGQIEASIGLTDSFELGAVYPNPFVTRASLSLSVREAQRVTVEVFNVLGQRVRTIYSDDVQANEATVVNIDSQGLPSGTYLVRAQGKTFVATRTVSVLH